MAPKLKCVPVPEPEAQWAWRQTMPPEPDSGIPVPPKLVQGPRKSPVRLFIEALQPGESFFLPCDGGEAPVKLCDRLEGIARACGKQTGRRFAVRALFEKGVSGARLWRTA
jgi:hypothetical protein